METLLGLGLAPGKKNSIENLKPRAKDEYLPRFLGSNLYKWLGKNFFDLRSNLPTFSPNSLKVKPCKDASCRMLLGSNVKKWLGYKIFDLPCNPNLTRGVASFSTSCRPNWKLHSWLVYALTSPTLWGLTLSFLLAGYSQGSSGRRVTLLISRDQFLHAI